MEMTPAKRTEMENTSALRIVSMEMTHARRIITI